MPAAERPEVCEFSLQLERLPEPLALKARALRGELEKLARPSGGLALAYSGGLDSRFLAFFASSLQIPVRLLHVTGPHVPETESRAALESARAMGFERVEQTENFDEARGRFDRTIELLALDPLTNDAIFTSGTDRCYVCKSTLFRVLKDRAAPLPLADGTNASDLGVYRPGLRALRELGIHSPLADANVAKDEIRALGRALGFTDPEQAARPCLLTRYPTVSVRRTRSSLFLRTPKPSSKRIPRAKDEGFGSVAPKRRAPSCSLMRAGTPRVHARHSKCSLRRSPRRSGRGSPVSRVR